ncbi:MAG: LamG domain-containing protein [Patescibacteria group bacterium]
MKKILTKPVLIAVFVVVVITTGVSLFIFQSSQEEVAAAEWFNEDWLYRREFDVGNYTTDETDVYIAVTIDTSDTTKHQGDCGDLRFTDGAGNLLDHYISSGCSGASTVTHVLFDTLVSGTSTVLYYYGNASVNDGFEPSAFTTEASNYAVGTIGSEEQGLGPMSYWSFDEGYGQTAYDYASEGIDGELGSTSGSDTNDPTWASPEFCKKGGCLQFDGDDDYVDFGYQNDIHNNSGSFTFSLWSRGFGYQNGVSHSDGGHGGWMGAAGSRGVAFGPDDLGESNFWVPIDASNLVAMSTTNVNDEDEWIHWAYVYDATNQLTIMYKNGIEVNRKDSGDSVPTSIYTGNTISFKIGDRGDGTTNWDGFIDEVKYYPYARSAAQIELDMNDGNATSFGGTSSVNKRLADGLVGWWKLDETADNQCTGGTNDVCDSTFFDHDGTVSGDPATTSTAKFGFARDFDGTDDALNLGTPSDLIITGAMTVSVWVRSEADNNERLISKIAGAADRAFDLSTDAGTGGYWAQFTIYDASNNGYSTYSSAQIDNNEWHLVTGVYKPGEYVALYIDGELDSLNTSNIPTSQRDDGNTLWVGSDNSATPQNDFDGQMDDVRIYNRALSDDEVNQLYEWRPDPVHYWSLNEKTGTDVYDRGVYDDDASFSGSGTHWDTGKYGSGANLNGSDDTLTVTDSTNFDNMGVGSFTVWIKPDEITSGAGIQSTIMTKNAGGSNNGDISCGLTQTGTYRCDLDDGTGSTTLVSTTAVPLDDWTHIAVTWTTDAITSTVTVYVNGIPEASTTKDGGYTPFAANVALAIASSNMNGQLDEVKMYNYTLTPREILQDMNAGRTNNPIAYWSFDESQGTTAYDTGNFYNATGAGNDGTLTNMTTAGTSTAWAAGKKGTALHFDGSNDYVQVADNDSLDFDDKSFSVNFWARKNADTPGSYDRARIIEKWTGGGFYIKWLDTEDLQIYMLDDDSDQAGFDCDANLEHGVWYNVTVVFDRPTDVIRCYIDTELVDEYDFSSSNIDNLSGTHVLRFGGNVGGTTYNFDGSLDEIKIYNYALTREEMRQNFNTGQQIALSKNASEIDDAYEGLVGWWKMDEDSWDTSADQVRDYSGLGKHGTSAGTANASSSAKFGRSGEFDGDSDYVSAGTSAITGSEFTISQWVRCTNCATTQTLQNVFVDSNNRIWLYISGDDITFFSEVGNVTTASVASSGNVLTDNTWHHVALVVRNDSISIYVDGDEVAVTETTFIPGSSYGIAGTLYHGAYNGASSFLAGQLDDVKIYNSALTKADISNEYYEGPSPVGYWKFDEKSGSTASDFSGIGNDGAHTGTVAYQNAASCKVGGCIELRGQGDADYIDVKEGGATPEELSFDDYEPWSVSAWILDEDTTNSFEFWIGNDSTNQGINLRHSSANEIRFRDNAGTYHTLLSDNSAYKNVWAHYVFTADGDGNMILYINGKRVGSASAVPTTFNIDFIGRGYSNDSYNLDGKLDEVKVFNYALTGRQAAFEYNNGAPFLHYSFDEGEAETIFDHGSGSNNGTLRIGTSGGQTTTSTAWTNGASNGQVNSGMEFDGSDDYVIGDSNLGISGNAAFSMSAWFYYDNGSWSTNYPSIMGNNSSGVANTGLSLTVRQGQPALDFWNNRYRADDALELYTWYHVVVTKDLGTIGATSRIYINGEEVSGSVENSDVNPNITDSPPIVGRLDGTRWFNGYIDEAKWYHYPLAPEDVKREYNNGFANFFK